VPRVGVLLVGFIGTTALLIGHRSQVIAGSGSTPTTPPSVRLAQSPQAEAPLTIVFPSRADSTDMQRKSDAVAAFLTQEMRMPVQAVVADDTAAVEALRANRADVAFVNTRSAIRAGEAANAKLYLAEVRENYSGGQTYRSIFVVRQDSPLKPLGNEMKTLGQLKGKRMTFTSPTSGSGFIFPLAKLMELKLVSDRDRLNEFFGQVNYGGGYSGALQAVLRGQADAAAVSEYTLQPPYVTAEEAKQLRILSSISGVPAHGIVIDDDVPVATRKRLIAALLKLNQSSNNKLLRDLYNSTRLVEVNGDQHLAPMRKSLQQVGITP
jgi:phosphonate transport system substrate-binding protein